MQNKQIVSIKEATGVIQYNMTNDYMFRYILQKTKKYYVVSYALCFI